MKVKIYLFTLYFKVLFNTKRNAYKYMNNPPARQQEEKAIRRWVLLFIITLVLSGLTAFALETELHWLLSIWPGGHDSSLYAWVQRVYVALRESNTRYPFLAYGYDWLAFAHLIIALFFVGVLRHPVQNKWVVEVGMLACVLVFPLAFIAGAVRGIPF